MFFHNSLQPLPRLHRCAVRDLQSSQRNASVQSLLVAGIFCTTNSSREQARERWQTFENSKNKTIFNGHPVLLVFSVNEHYLPTLLQHLKRLRAFVVSKHV